MPKTSLAYDRPSRMAQVLVVGFSVAAVLMTGWLVVMFMVSREGTSGDAAPDAMAVATPSPPHIENPGQTVTAPPFATQGVRPDGTVAWPDAPAPPVVTAPPATTASSASALSAGTTANIAPPAAAAAPAPGPWPASGSTALAAPPPAAPTYATSSLPDYASEPSYRGVPAEDLMAPADGTTGGLDPSELVPLPIPRPRHASVPMPRPRPHIDEPAEAQESQDKTLFDLLIGRQK